MKNFLALIAAAALLSGCDFVGGTGAAPIALSSLTIVDTPLPMEADGSAPDLYVEIQDTSGRMVLQAPSIREEADASALPYRIDLAGTLAGGSRYVVVVMEYDEDGYDLIATSRAFTAGDLRAAGSVFEITDEATTLRAEITLAR